MHTTVLRLGFVDRDMLPFVKGLIIGFSIAAPVGPIGLLCIRRSMTQGRVAGFVSGLGAATADAVYGVIAALGLNAIMQVLFDYRSALQLGGGLFLLWLGFTTFRARPPASAAQTRETAGLLGAYMSTFALTLTNPMTILSFIGIFAGLGLDTSAGGASAAAWLVLGVFLGSALWWVILSAAASWFGQKLQSRGLRAVNMGSGLAIAGFGAWQLMSLARG